MRVEMVEDETGREDFLCTSLLAALLLHRRRWPYMVFRPCLKGFGRFHEVACLSFRFA